MKTVHAHPPGIPRQRVRTHFDAELNPSRTQQHMKETVDINNIVARYQRTGALDHFNKHGATYGEVPSVDFREAMEIVRHGQHLFADLPSSLRERFNHSPEEFLAFVQNPENRDEMADLGLLRPEAATTVAAPPVETPPEPRGEG